MNPIVDLAGSESGDGVAEVDQTAVTSQLLDQFYAELLRCRDHCGHPPGDHVTVSGSVAVLAAAHAGSSHWREWRFDARSGPA
jgi:hypothetical protein